MIKCMLEISKEILLCTVDYDSYLVDQQSYQGNSSSFVNSNLQQVLTLMEEYYSVKLSKNMLNISEFTLFFCVLLLNNQHQRAFELIMSICNTILHQLNQLRDYSTMVINCNRNLITSHLQIALRLQIFVSILDLVMRNFQLVVPNLVYNQLNEASREFIIKYRAVIPLACFCIRGSFFFSSSYLR
jgi:hypothetical protein